jgi:hypothetical protein
MESAASAVSSAGIKSVATNARLNSIDRMIVIPRLATAMRLTKCDSYFGQGSLEQELNRPRIDLVSSV